MAALQTLQSRVVTCKQCPRLVRYMQGLKTSHTDWWCRPVPSWGDPKAKLLVVGLAPAARGANRTGRMFTGDLTGGSGHWVYGILHELGLANQPTAESAHDGLTLKGTYITAIIRCAPPENKPTPLEILTCARYLAEELTLLTRLRVIVALGKTAHDTLIKLHGGRLSDFPFSHGREHRLKSGLTLLDTYHPSRQNTFTKRLTYPLWRTVWCRAIRLAKI